VTAPDASAGPGGDLDARAGAVFAALADPTRRRVVQRLAAAPATPTELAEGLPVSRQAVAKHLAALASAGLVQAERDGRRVRYALDPVPMTEALAWMASVGGAWDERLRRLRALVDGPEPS
jgi:DNA-binding transcriptional ArsR family regulator